MTKYFLGTFFFLARSLSATVTVTQGTFPYHCYQQSDYKSQLTDIIIAEGANSDFSADRGIVTYEIKTPQNGMGENQYEFLNDVGAVTFRSGGDIESIDFISITSTKLTFGYTCPTNTGRDTIRISGLKIRSIGWSAYNYYLRRSGGTALQNGNTTAVHATFTNINAGASIIAPSRSFYCHDDTTSYLIKAAYQGGVISGTTYSSAQFNSGGYEQIYFKPSLVPDTGVFSFQYSVTTSGCTYTASVTSKIHYVPSPILVSTDTVFCKNDVVTFTARPSQGFLHQFMFLYANSDNVLQSSSADSTWIFNYSGASGRKVFVETRLASDPQCPARSSFITPIEHPEPVLSVSLDPALPAQLCSNAPARSLVPSNYTGGIFSGSGVSGTTFDPTTAVIGNNTVTYTIDHPTCGIRTFNTNFTVTAAPTVTLTSSDADHTICNGDHVVFTANTGGTANRYLFSKNNNGIQGPNLNHTYSSAALSDGDVISVTVDNGANTCATTSNAITTTVGDYPVARFEWDAACGSDVVSFDDLSTLTQSGSAIVSWDWDYTNNNSTDLHQTSNSDHSHDYNSYGNYTAKLTVTTDRGCSDSYSVKVATQPTRQPLPTDPYIEEFESDDGAWANFGINDSWGWGATSNVLNNGSKKIWSTGFADGLYKQSEESYIGSPCFNLEMLTKPMIAIKLKSAVPDKLAGAILEASTDNGETWQRVGLKDQGVNWYDEVALLASPGENNNGDYGWSGNYNDWKVARIGLGQFAGNPAVKLRIAFASGPNAQYYNGIAIDSIWIGNRNKLTVIEHFTTKAGFIAPKTAVAYVRIDSIHRSRITDVVSIHYHTSFPNPDIYASFNFSDPGARALYYGIGTVPRTVYDGTSFNDSTSNFNTQHIDKRVLALSPFKIDLTTQITSTAVNAIAKITNVGTNLISRRIVLHFVIVEDSASGNVGDNYVERKMLPDAAGNPFSGNWPVNRSETISRVWNNHTLGNGKLSVIAYAQDVDSKEVLQAAIVKGTGTYGDPVEVGVLDPLKESAFSVHPNPANEYLFVNCFIKEDAKVELVSMTGQILKAVHTNASEEISIPILNIESGMYLVKVSTKSGNVSYKKIIISR